MTNDARQKYLSSVRTIVVKLGTQLLSDSARRLDGELMGGIAQQVAELRARRIFVTVVSSGAIAAGVNELKLPGRPADLARLQAVAAVGQRRLMDAWAAAFEPHGLPVGQVLLTREDIDDRSRFLNVRNTIRAIHEMNAVPIINENDTISTDELIEISFGDNDILAALVAHALQADLLVLMTIVDGLLDKQGEPVRLVENLVQAGKLVRNEKSSLGKGGMNSKLEAARMLTGAGDSMVVADGRAPNLLPRLLDGELLGTFFAPSIKRRRSRSRWIGSVRPVGDVVVDEGAVHALLERNCSLLPAGIVRIEGSFARGDCVAIRAPSQEMIARGLSNYTSTDLRSILGKKTAEVRAALGEAAYEEAIHRDNLVVE